MYQALGKNGMKMANLNLLGTTMMESWKEIKLIGSEMDKSKEHCICSNGRYNGERKEWHENGQLKSVSHYTDGMWCGEWLSYSSDGKILGTQSYVERRRGFIGY